MTITVVCRKSKIAWLFLPCVLLLASCGKRQVTKSATVEAQQTAGKIRQGWATACRPLTITSEGMETGLPDIGVYMHLADATDTERNAFYGVPFIYDNGRYVAQKHHTVTADTLAAIGIFGISIIVHQTSLLVVFGIVTDFAPLCKLYRKFPFT